MPATGRDHCGHDDLSGSQSTHQIHLEDVDVAAQILRIELAADARAKDAGVDPFLPENCAQPLHVVAIADVEHMVAIASVHNWARPARDASDLPAAIKQPPRAVQPDAVGVSDDDGVTGQGRHGARMIA